MLHHPLGGPLCSVSLRGGGQATAFSRRDRARGLFDSCPRKKAEGAERREAQFSLSSAHTDTRCRWSMLRARKRALSGRARLPALRSGSRRDFDIPAQLQAMLPGTWSRRALSVLSCPSPAKAPRASVVMPKGMMPKAARVRGYEARPQAPRRLHFQDRL
jgi:hypothetical protein